jgi:GH24 family phage-related lysozyme (muramidase)
VLVKVAEEEEGVVLSLTLRDAIRRDLDRWEGFYAWMYLDSEGLVTIGYGSMLPNAAAAAAIPFVKNQGGAATTAEIRAAYAAVQSGAVAQKAAPQRQKFGANRYKTVTDLRITQATASGLRDRHIDADYLQLQAIYQRFDTFPDNAKLALFDMIYNLGAGHGKTRHHRAAGLRAYAGMNAAIARGDWSTAALHCLRHGIPLERNVATAELFRSCAVANVRASR